MILNFDTFLQFGAHFTTWFGRPSPSNGKQATMFTIKRCKHAIIKQQKATKTVRPSPDTVTLILSLSITANLR
jgi:hypothetical protein